MYNPGGKGSAARPMEVDRKTYEDNFDKIFRKKKVEDNKDKVEDNTSTDIDKSEKE